MLDTVKQVASTGCKLRGLPRFPNFDSFPSEPATFGYFWLIPTQSPTSVVQVTPQPQLPAN